MKTSTKYGCDVRRLDGNTPLATFIFKYRDVGPYIYPLRRILHSTLVIGLLQANGIIPRPPPAKKKAPVPGGVLDLTFGDDVKAEPIGEEIEIVNGATQSQKRPAILTKRSNSSREVKPAKRIKRENKIVPTGEVIDLT